MDGPPQPAERAPGLRAAPAASLLIHRSPRSPPCLALCLLPCPSLSRLWGSRPELPQQMSARCRLQQMSARCKLLTAATVCATVVHAPATTTMRIASIYICLQHTGAQQTDTRGMRPGRQGAHGWGKYTWGIDESHSVTSDAAHVQDTHHDAEDLRNHKSTAHHAGGGGGVNSHKLEREPCGGRRSAAHRPLQSREHNLTAPRSGEKNTGNRRTRHETATHTAVHTDATDKSCAPGLAGKPVCVLGHLTAHIIRLLFPLGKTAGPQPNRPT